LKHSVNKLVTYILYYYAGPGCLFYCCKLCCFLHGCHSYLSPASPVVVLVESYKTVIERRYYVSCINIIELFDLQFVHSDTACKCRTQVCELLCVSFKMLPCGFVQTKALKLGVRPLIVHPIPCCGRHCFYLRCCQVFLGPLIVPVLLQ